MTIYIIDTNIWLSEFGLRSPMACAFLHYVTIGEHKIGLPEIIEIETIKNIKENLYSYRDKCKEQFGFILTIMGKLNELVLPSDAELDKAAKKIFERYENLITRVKIEDEHLRSSLNMLIEKVPPNSDKNQQYKDCVIWQQSKSLLKNDNVIFITNDNGFYENRKGNILAESLALDLKTFSTNLIIKRDLQSAVDEIHKKRMSEKIILDAINKKVRQQLTDLVSESGYTVGEIIYYSLKQFATENHNVICVKYELKYSIICFLEEHPKDNDTATSNGQVNINLNGMLESDLVKDRAEINYHEEGDARKRHSYAYLQSISFGKINVVHSVMKEI